MEQFILYMMAIILILFGVIMLIRPSMVALQNREEGDKTRPISTGEIWTMRIAGAVLAAGGAYFLYALITRMPGAEFTGV